MKSDSVSLLKSCRSLATLTDGRVPPKIRVAAVLTRSPLLTRKPTPFEAAFFEYQNRLRMALSNPFPHDFYFKPGSLLIEKFRLEEKRRRNWLFERRLAADASKKERRRVREASEAVEEVFSPRKRKTVADIFANTRSLNRLGDRTLYLVLRRAGNPFYWFPDNAVHQGELLHQASFLL